MEYYITIFCDQMQGQPLPRCPPAPTS